MEIAKIEEIKIAADKLKTLSDSMLDRLEDAAFSADDLSEAAGEAITTSEMLYSESENLVCLLRSEKSNDSIVVLDAAALIEILSECVYLRLLNESFGDRVQNGKTLSLAYHTGDLVCKLVESLKEIR